MFFASTNAIHTALRGFCFFSFTSFQFCLCLSLSAFLYGFFDFNTLTSWIFAPWIFSPILAFFCFFLPGLQDEPGWWTSGCLHPVLLFLQLLCLMGVGTILEAASIQRTFKSSPLFKVLCFRLLLKKSWIPSPSLKCVTINKLIFFHLNR